MTGDRGCVKVLWSLFNEGLLFIIKSSVSLSTKCLVWGVLLALISLGLEFVDLLPCSLFVFVQDDNSESTLNDILCLRNTGAENVLLFAQDSAIVAAEGEDVDATQFLVLIAWVIIMTCFCTYTGLHL
jgi:hypothetical protein